MRLILTSGHGRALHVLAIAELLRRRGDEVVAIITVSTLNLRRARTLLRQRGSKFARAAASQVVGWQRETSGGGMDPMHALLERYEIPRQSLRQWGRRHGTRVMSVADLNAERSRAIVAAVRPDAVLYGGGGILRREFLAAAEGRVLNVHSGPLPDVRGMNACEWSVLLGLQPTVTVHRIDQGIDTGAAVLRRPVPVCPGDDLGRLRRRCVAEGVEAMVQATADLPADWVTRPAPLPVTRQCFVMAPALLELAEHRLRQRPEMADEI